MEDVAKRALQGFAKRSGQARATADPVHSFVFFKLERQYMHHLAAVWFIGESLLVWLNPLYVPRFVTNRVCARMAVRRTLVSEAVRSVHTVVNRHTIQGRPALKAFCSVGLNADQLQDLEAKRAHFAQHLRMDRQIDGARLRVDIFRCHGEKPHVSEKRVKLDYPNTCTLTCPGVRGLYLAPPTLLCTWESGDSYVQLLLPLGRRTWRRACRTLSASIMAQRTVSMLWPLWKKCGLRLCIGASSLRARLLQRRACTPRCVAKPSPSSPILPVAAGTGRIPCRAKAQTTPSLSSAWHLPLPALLPVFQKASEDRAAWPRVRRGRCCSSKVGCARGKSMTACVQKASACAHRLQNLLCSHQVRGRGFFKHVFGCFQPSVAILAQVLHVWDWFIGCDRVPLRGVGLGVVLAPCGQTPIVVYFTIASLIMSTWPGVSCGEQNAAHGRARIAPAVATLDDHPIVISVVNIVHLKRSDRNRNRNAGTASTRAKTSLADIVRQELARATAAKGDPHQPAQEMDVAATHDSEPGQDAQAAPATSDIQRRLSAIDCRPRRGGGTERCPQTGARGFHSAAPSPSLGCSKSLSRPRTKQESDC